MTATAGQNHEMRIGMVEPPTLPCVGSTDLLEVRWHSVAERLPQPGRLVMVWSRNRVTDDYRWLLARYDRRGIWFAFYGPSAAVEVSHWVELPKPPKDF